MTEHVDERVSGSHHHAPGHGDAIHGQLRMNAGHDDVELVEQVGFLVKRSVVKDVALDAGENPKRRQLLVEFGHHLELRAQPLRSQAVCDRQSGRVIGEHHVVVRPTRQRARRVRHLLDRAAAIAPVRMRMQITAQRGAQLLAPGHERSLASRQQLRQVFRHLTADRFAHDRRGCLADAGEVGQRAVLRAPLDLASGQLGQHVRRRAKRLHAVGRLARPFKQKRNLPERLNRVSGHDGDQYRSPFSTSAAAPTSPAS